jgi:hypothetical protein
VEREALEAIEAMLAHGAETEATVSLALLAGQAVELDEDEVRAPLRRAMLLLAAGGDPTRELELDGRAVGAVAADLDTPERRDALARALAALDEYAETLPHAAAALARLRAEPDLAWRAFACALIAGELADETP